MGKLTVNVPQVRGDSSSIHHHWKKAAPKLSEWMEENLPEGLTVFVLPAAHQVSMRTTNA